MNNTIENGINNSADKEFTSSEHAIGNPDLPIWQVMPEIIETLESGNRLALVSETGSGKSTQVPQALYEAGFADKGTIFIVENRVTVAVEVAKRVSSEMHSPIGTTVGYLTGPERKTRPETKIVFVTNGVFKNIIRNDPLLEQASVVIFDEFDERYLLSDIGLALTEKAQNRGGDVKFILMSATLNAGKIQDHFQGIPLIEAQGRPYPIDTHFADRDVPTIQLPREAAKIVANIHSSTDTGDILIFMPGKGEIEDTIKKILALKVEGTELLPLHAELTPDEQAKVFAKSPHRKIIVSTNVAERGLTIDGVKFVIDSGLARMNDYDPVADVSKLGVMPCAQDSMRQRQGRAGRTQPGECYFLITKENYEKREKSTKPEIQRSPLRSIVLQIKAMGYSREGDPIRLMDSPEKQNWVTAKDQLRQLVALDMDDETKLSPFGEELAELGIDPRDGAMVLSGYIRGCGEAMATVAAIRSATKRLLYKPKEEADQAETRHRSFRLSKESDLINMLLVYKQAEAHDFDYVWCKENYVSWQALTEIRRTKDQLTKKLKSMGYKPETTVVDEKVYAQAIAAGFPDKVFESIGGDWYQNADTGERALLGRESSIHGAERVIANEFIRIQTKKGTTLPLITMATIAN